MRITNSKGKKEEISSFFHSKKDENEFRKYYTLFSFMLGVLFFLISFIIFIVVQWLLLAFILVFIVGIVMYILKEKYLPLTVTVVMNRKLEEGEKLKISPKYDLEVSSKKKNKQLHNYLKTKKNIWGSIKGIFTKKKNKEGSYIEIE